MYYRHSRGLTEDLPSVYRMLRRSAAATLSQIYREHCIIKKVLLLYYATTVTIVKLLLHVHLIAVSELICKFTLVIHIVNV